MLGLEISRVTHPLVHIWPVLNCSRFSMLCMLFFILLNYLQRTRLYRRLMIWLLPRPLPPSLPSVNSTCDTQEDWERETTCWRERGKEWGLSWGAKSYDGEKAWSSINHSILSAIHQREWKKPLGNVVFVHVIVEWLFFEGTLLDNWSG